MIGANSTLTTNFAMLKTHFFQRTLPHFVLLIVSVCFAFPAFNKGALAQATTEQAIVVTGEEVPSAYGAPPAFSRSRFSNAVNAYVLPPWAFFFGEIYEGEALRHGPPDH